MVKNRKENIQKKNNFCLNCFTLIYKQKNEKSKKQKKYKNIKYTKK